MLKKVASNFVWRGLVISLVISFGLFGFCAYGDDEQLDELERVLIGLAGDVDAIVAEGGLDTPEAIYTAAENYSEELLWDFEEENLFSEEIILDMIGEQLGLIQGNEGVVLTAEEIVALQGEIGEIMTGDFGGVEFKKIYMHHLFYVLAEEHRKAGRIAGAIMLHRYSLELVTEAEKCYASSVFALIRIYRDMIAEATDNEVIAEKLLKIKVLGDEFAQRFTDDSSVYRYQMGFTVRNCYFLAFPRMLGFADYNSGVYDAGVVAAESVVALRPEQGDVLRRRNVMKGWKLGSLSVDVGAVNGFSTVGGSVKIVDVSPSNVFPLGKRVVDNRVLEFDTGATVLDLPVYVGHLYRVTVCLPNGNGGVSEFVVNDLLGAGDMVYSSDGVGIVAKNWADGNGEAKLVLNLDGDSLGANSRYVIKAVPALGWKCKDVGAYRLNGKTAWVKSEFVMKGEGARIENRNDHFFFSYTKMSGDCEIIAKMNRVEQDQWMSQAGIMIRENLSNSARSVSMVLAKDAGMYVRYRIKPRLLNMRYHFDLDSPVWLRLRRYGDYFACFTSDDGVNWNLIKQAQVQMSEDVYVGLCAVSYRRYAYTTVGFSDVQALPLDSDGDGVFDYEELGMGSDVNEADSDGDGMDDGWEWRNGLQVLVSSADNDADGDGISDLNEYLGGSCPVLPSQSVAGYDYHKVGVLACYYKGSFTKMPYFNRLALYGADMQEGIGFKPTADEVLGSGLRDRIAVVFSAKLRIPATGRYRFFMASDDGSALFVDGVRVINNIDPKNMALRSGARRLMAGLHDFRVEYFDFTGKAGLRLYWKGPGMIMNELSSDYLLFSEQLVIDQVAKIDRDADSLPDALEISTYNTDPNNPDCDGDGLLDGEEVFLYDTNPNLVDTDGDGWNDFVETMQLGTDATKVDLAEESIVANILGSAGVGVVGCWDSNGNAIVSKGRSGSVKYGLNLPENNVYVVELKVSEFNALRTDNSRFQIVASVDGKFVTQRVIRVAHGEHGTTLFVLPYLEAGVHQLNLQWRNSKNHTFLQVDSVTVKTIAGEDLDNDNRPDWQLARMARMVSLAENTPTESLVSPVCVEGTALCFDYLKLLSSYIPEDSMPTENGMLVNSTAKGLSYFNIQNWYANVPLNPVQDTVVTGNWQNGEKNQTTYIAWNPTNMFDHDNITIRKGDSLLLTAFPEHSLWADITITVDGTDYQLAHQPTSTLIGGLGGFGGFGGFGGGGFGGGGNSNDFIDAAHETFINLLPQRFPDANKNYNIAYSPYYLGVRNNTNHPNTLDDITVINPNAYIVGDKLAYLFDQPGVYQITAVYAPHPYRGQQQDPTTVTLTVTVLETAFANNPICFVGKKRTWKNPNIPNQAVLVNDYSLNYYRKNLSSGGCNLELFMHRAKPARILARLKQEDGPVMAGATIQAVVIHKSADEHFDILHYFDDGSQLVEGRITLDYVPEDISITIKVVIGNSVFEDGTLEKTFTAEDFSATGELTFRFIRPQKARHSICHEYEFYQNGELINKL